MRIVMISVVIGIILWMMHRWWTEISESFVLDIPDSVDVETVSSEVLNAYKVSKASALDHDVIMKECASLESDIGTSKTYTVNDMSLKAFVEDVYNTKGDYSQLLHKYVSFPMAIVYNAESNSILYYTVEKPWNLKPNIFQNEKYLSAFEDGRVYIPQWGYSKTDPGPLSIDPQCLKMLNEWKDSEDSDLIKQLEQEECLSRSNKIKFVGMILLQYLKILRKNRFGFAQACGDFRGITSNIKNPELRKIFDDVNKVCDDQGAFAAGVTQQCVLPVNTWLDTGEDPTDTTCLSTTEKTDIISRITKLLEIGDTIPVDFLDSFYLIVTKLYSDTKNILLKDALRNFTSTSEHAEKWKKLFDSLYKNIIKPKSILINNKVTPEAGVDGNGWSGTEKDFPLTISFVFDRFFKFNTIVTQAVGKLELQKYALSYEDPFVPGKFVDFDRVLYGNNSTKVDGLNGVITKTIKLKPLERGSIGVKVGFEGSTVLLDRCSQKVSICELDSTLSEEKSKTESMRKRYDLERKNRMKMLQKLSTMTGDIQRLQKDLKEKDLKLGQKCPPQRVSLPRPEITIKKQLATPPPTTYILVDSSKKSVDDSSCT